MSESELSRRQFHKLAAAALGGVVTGVAVGCGGKKSPAKTADGNAADGKAAADTGKAGDGSDTKGADTSSGSQEVSLLMQEPHVCKGLNACKGKGMGGKNECAGQGACATAKKHDCTGMNECKGQGGCGEKAGVNACKGKGECAVPLNAKTWAKARTAFEKVMKAADKKFSPAPKA